VKSVRTYLEESLVSESFLWPEVAREVLAKVIADPPATGILWDGSVKDYPEGMVATLLFACRTTAIEHLADKPAAISVAVLKQQVGAADVPHIPQDRK
jgi:hypothetical protein